MMRTAAVLCLVVLAACFESHSDTAEVVRSRDCFTCHKAEYQETGIADGRFPAAPNHGELATDGQPTCSTDCAVCHTTEVWQNGLGGCRHPDAKFPLVTRGATDRSPSPHINIECTACHNPEIGAALGVSSAAGLNTDCTSCHPRSETDPTHGGAVGDATSKIPGQPYSYSTSDHRFCLDCHPDGLVHGHGPTNQFRLPHHGATCAKCHDSASGLGHTNGADTLCVSSGCHDGSDGEDRAHCAGTAGGQRHHPTCLNSGCHPDGRKHDGNESCP